MAADAGKTIVLLGVVGVGGYTVFEYIQYQNALNAITSKVDTTGTVAQQVQAALPFMSYLFAAFSPPAAGTEAASALALIQAAQAGTLTAAATTTPGTTSSGQVATTTVSTTPTTTATTTGSTAPSTTTTATTAASTPQPTAADLQNALNLSLASPDQWNYAYRELTGYGIEQIYGGNFDAIYGPIGANGQRPTGNITAQAFLNLPTAKGLAQTALSGLGNYRRGFGRMGAIARFYTPVVNPMASMVYRAQHPSPYRLPVSGGMMGLGAVTQATGFEKALWAGGFIRSRRVR